MLINCFDGITALARMWLTEFCSTVTNVHMCEVIQWHIMTDGQKYPFFFLLSKMRTQGVCAYLQWPLQLIYYSILFRGAKESLKCLCANVKWEDFLPGSSCCELSLISQPRLESTPQSPIGGSALWPLCLCFLVPCPMSPRWNGGGFWVNGGRTVRGRWCGPLVRGTTPACPCIYLVFIALFNGGKWLISHICAYLDLIPATGCVPHSNTLEVCSLGSHVTSSAVCVANIDLYCFLASSVSCS